MCGTSNNFTIIVTIQFLLHESKPSLKRSVPIESKMFAHSEKEFMLSFPRAIFTYYAASSKNHEIVM